MVKVIGLGKVGKVRVFAPATTANVGPGFDIFGVALNGIGDIVEANVSDSFRGVRLAEIVVGSSSESLSHLPKDERNLVFPVAKAVYDAAGRAGSKGAKDSGVEIRLIKRMGIGTGLGSSGSSSVAAAVAVNEALGSVFARDSPEMLAAVLEGEFVACGSRHADNVFPSLLGGFVFIEDPVSFRFRKFEIGSDVFFVVVTPDVVISTKEAREALGASPYNIRELVSFSSSIVKQYLSTGSRSLGRIPASVVGNGSAEVVSTYLEGMLEVLAGLVGNDVELLGRGTLKDGIVTPIRAGLIPGYDDVKRAALKAGAKGFSISGSGPSVFAVAYGEDAEAVGKAMVGEFERRGKRASCIISTVNNKGACMAE